MSKIYGPGSSLSMHKQSRSKILVDIDGHTYSGRFPVLIWLGSAVFKIAAFEDVITVITQPWKHYVPVKMDLSDLEAKLKWAKAHDQ